MKIALATIALILTCCCTTYSYDRISKTLTNLNNIVRSDSVNIVSEYSKITSIRDMISLFKNKPILIDLWATWCSPCYEEFKHGGELKRYLKGNGIEMVYLSFDKDKDDILWNNKIRELNLAGNHIRASKSLRDEITMLLWHGIDAYSLPTYILFDESGKIVSKGLSAPSKGPILLKEIEFLLNNNSSIHYNYTTGSSVLWVIYYYYNTLSPGFTSIQSMIKYTLSSCYQVMHQPVSFGMF